MSSDKTPECDEAELHAKFERQTRGLREKIGDRNRDGNLSAAEIEREIRANPEGPLAKLLRLQAMPALRNMQMEIGALHAIANKPELVEKIEPAALQGHVTRAEERITNAGRSAFEKAIYEPLNNIRTQDLCSLSQEVASSTAQSLQNGFSVTDKAKQKIVDQVQQGVLMLKSLNSVEIGSVQVLYDHLATDEDRATVKSGIDQRVKQATQPQQPPQKPPTTRC